MNDREFWATAERACTEKQLAVLRLKARGFSKRRIADVLDVAVGTVEGHLSAASRNMRRVTQDSECQADVVVDESGGVLKDRFGV